MRVPSEQLHRREIAGVSTRIWVVGEGPPLILLHGFPETLAGWSEVAPRLARRHRVYAFDWPGQGESSAPASMPLNPFALAAFLTAFLDAEAIDRAHVVGVDIGMPPALILAAQQPARVMT